MPRNSCGTTIPSSGEVAAAIRFAAQTSTTIRSRKAVLLLWQRSSTRYGYSQQVSDPDDPWITRKLIAELRSEQFDEPDDEHTRVFVGNEHWAVTAQVSGLITFENMDLLEGEESDLPVQDAPPRSPPYVAPHFYRVGA